MEFIEKPYLPQKRITVAVGDIKIQGALVIKPYRAECMPPSMKYHGDLSFCCLGQGVCVCAPEAYDYYNEHLKDRKVKLIKGESVLSGNYPYDAAYNVAIVGDKIFCKKAITDPILLYEAEKMGYKTVNINQGYAKCSVCPVDEKSAISADASFIKSAEKEGVEVLKVTNGNICLDGFDNGFFGGCCFMTDKKTFSLKGDIRTLPQYGEIKEFLEKRGISIIHGNGPVTDFGSLIPIMEE